MPGMDQQAESPTMKPGDRCPFCGDGTLVRSPSGLNLLCRTCDRITLLPQAHRSDGRTDATRHGRQTQKALLDTSKTPRRLRPRTSYIRVIAASV